MSLREYGKNTEFINRQMNKKVVVIGGGPAGMMAAITASLGGCDVILIEKNNILGKKLLITGKGRCNVTNFCDVENVMQNINSKNPKFMYSALNAFSCYDTYAFFEELGVPLKIERGNRVFPVSDKAADIRNALVNKMKDSGVSVCIDNVVSISTDPVSVKTEKTTYLCDAIIIATGGLSYPLTGSTGDGYKFARLIGNKVTKTTPSLVALRSSDSVCPRLMGLSLKNISISVFDNDKIVYSDFGEMLFTHNGVSGPVILSASAKLDFTAKIYRLSIDLKPALSLQELDQRILKDFSKYSNKDFLNSLSDLLPKKIIPCIIERCGIDPRMKVNSITKEQRQMLVNVIKAFDVNIVGKAGYNEAVITAGGVDLSQIDPKTMCSTAVKGIYFAGEVLDIDANTGGYNLQIAFSTGYVAGKSVAQEV